MNSAPENGGEFKEALLTDTNLISFRLPPEFFPALQALQVKGESPSKTAKRLFCGQLCREYELEVVNENLRVLSQQIEDLRSVLLRAAEGLIVATGRLTKDQAQDWIERKVCAPSERPSAGTNLKK
jgi:hypothetical protein